ncbi:MAG: hypothetical protein O3A15_00210 [Proteobacteria bacterium]|nr:hypothetical protein [Pseudomonadota bacterium]
MKKVCIINQPEGLGDILYLQKIGYFFQEQGYEIYWPVNPFYCDYIGDYLNNFNYFCNKNFQDPSEEHFIDMGLTKDIFELYLEYSGPRGEIYSGISGGIDLKIVPLNHLGSIRPANPEIMDNPGTMQKRKYAFVGVSDSDWPDYLHINRNTDKENDLYYNVLGLKDNEDYGLVNIFLGTPPSCTSTLSIILDDFLGSDSSKNGLRHISLDFIEGFTLFDWMKVIENAKEIWMEGSAITWICEKLNLKAEKLVLYQRNGNYNAEMHNLFSHPWLAPSHGPSVGFPEQSFSPIPLLKK